MLTLQTKIKIMRDNTHFNIYNRFDYAFKIREISNFSTAYMPLQRDKRSEKSNFVWKSDFYDANYVTDP